MSEDRLPNGTIVRTLKVDDPSDDWTEEALKTRQWGYLGKVIGHHDAHGLTYEVQHLDDPLAGTIGHYEPRELEVFEQPGPVFDKVVHTHVFDNSEVLTDVPPYSTDIAAAWKLVEQAFKDGHPLHICLDLDGQTIVHQQRWTMNSSTVRIWDDTWFCQSYKCPTTPHAICIAMLSQYPFSDEAEFLCEPWEYDAVEHDLRYYEVPKED